MSQRFKDITRPSKVSGQISSTQARQGQLISTDIPYLDYQTQGIIAATKPQGRLTLTSGVAVTTVDVQAATTVYWTPFEGNNIPIYDETVFSSLPFAELSLALDSNSGHTGYHSSLSNFDCFVFLNDGVVTLGTGPKWVSNTDRGTGAGTTELELLGGIYVNKYDITLRFGANSGNYVTCTAETATYVGTFRTILAAQVTDSNAFRYLWNAYNRVPRWMDALLDVDSWTYNDASWRNANDNLSGQPYVSYVAGLVIDLVSVDVFGAARNSTATERRAVVGVGIDSSTVNSAQIMSPGRAGEITTSLHSKYQGYPGLGVHTLEWLESSSTVDTMTFFGDDGSTRVQSGLTAMVWA